MRKTADLLRWEEMRKAKCKVLGELGDFTKERQNTKPIVSVPHATSLNVNLLLARVMERKKAKLRGAISSPRAVSKRTFNFSVPSSPSVPVNQRNHVASPRTTATKKQIVRTPIQIEQEKQENIRRKITEYFAMKEKEKLDNSGGEEKPIPAEHKVMLPNRLFFSKK